jgi:4'-phosphopantetheinyl transferase EntD
MLEVRFATLDELVASVGNLPPEQFWSQPEQNLLEQLHIPKRQREWMAGRIAAKQAVRQLLDSSGCTVPEPVDISIQSAPDRAPLVVWPKNRPAPSDVQISISHRAGWAGAAAVLAPARVGFDLEVIASRPPELVCSYLTAPEQAWIPGNPFLETLAWSIKESIYKLWRGKHGSEPRDVEIQGTPTESSVWAPLQLACHNMPSISEAGYRGFNGMLATYVTARGD